MKRKNFPGRKKLRQERALERLKKATLTKRIEMEVAALNAKLAAVGAA